MHFCVFNLQIHDLPHSPIAARNAGEAQRLENTKAVFDTIISRLHKLFDRRRQLASIERARRV